LAFVGSAENRYRMTLVSKNASAPLIGFEPVELEIRRQSAAIFPQSRQDVATAGALCYLEAASTGNDDLDIVALIEAEGIDHDGRQANGETVPPL
jgi:hypothetical protein